MAYAYTFIKVTWQTYDRKFLYVLYDNLFIDVQTLEDVWKKDDTQMAAFQRLRDVAIENLCHALKAGLSLEAHSVQAFLASVSNRVFMAEKEW